MRYYQVLSNMTDYVHGVVAAPNAFEAFNSLPTSFPRYAEKGGSRCDYRLRRVDFPCHDNGTTFCVYRCDPGPNTVPLLITADREEADEYAATLKNWGANAIIHTHKR
jgi:hypothetical protein